VLPFTLICHITSFELLIRYKIICPTCGLRSIVDKCFLASVVQESPADAARRESMPKIAPIRRADNVVADNTVYRYSFSCCFVRNLRNPEKFSETYRIQGHPRSSILDRCQSKLMRTCTFLLATNSNFGRIYYRFHESRY